MVRFRLIRFFARLLYQLSEWLERKSDRLYDCSENFRPETKIDRKLVKGALAFMDTQGNITANYRKGYTFLGVAATDVEDGTIQIKEHGHAIFKCN